MSQDRSVAQTLSRGLQILEILADAPEPLSAQQLAERIGVSRPIVYRLLRTLEAHGLLSIEQQAGKFDIGLGVLSLGRKLVRDLREAAMPELQRLTREYSATTFVGVREADEIVCVLSQEPDSHSLAIRHREGMRIPMKGASSWALLSAGAASADDLPEVVEARERGFAVSEGRVFPGALAVSAPIRRGGGVDAASLTIVFGAPELADRDRAARDIVDAAARISAAATL